MKKSRTSIWRNAIVASSTMLSLMLGLTRSDGRWSKKNDENNPPKILTAEQAGNKNIKELRGMPNAQLMPSMRFMSASLGVRCEFCHLSKDGKLDAAAENKKEKQTARDMIRMVKEINRANFKGEPQVSCFTCHVGQPIPQSFPILPVVMASPVPPIQPLQSAPPSFPSGSSVIDRYIETIGGEAAIEKIRSCVMTGKFTTASGASGTYEAEQVPPDSAYELIALSSFRRERGVRNRSGWEKTSLGAIDLLPQQVSDMQLSLPFLLDLQLKRQYSEAAVSGKEKIDNHDAYVVDATRKDDKRERLYFDVQNGLLVRRITYAPTMVGIIPEQIDLSDYRDVEGVKFPFSVRVSITDSNNPSNTRTFEQVRLNIQVEPSKFSKPSS